MHTAARYALVVIAVIISLHYLLTFTHEDYGRATSLEAIKNKFSPSRTTTSTESHTTGAPPLHVAVPTNPADLKDGGKLAVDPNVKPKPQVPRANATFIMLARNTDTDGAVRSVRQMEERFNRRLWEEWYARGGKKGQEHEAVEKGEGGYPYVFLNEVPFEDDFKKRLSVLSPSPMTFSLIPHDHWFQPSTIDETRAAREREKLVKDGVIYGGSVSYRNMCRYNSGFFFKHESVQKYRWYWRIEPDVHFHCNVDYDPFVMMETQNKTYGFTITMYEFDKTIPTLWGEVRKFQELHPEYVAKDNAMGYMSDDGGKSYNRCHFWSNFEIADMDFWRGEAYQKYFEFLDSKGGFYYERWGDAPVHSIAAGIFLPKSKLHFFGDMGYEHNPYIHCPLDKYPVTDAKVGWRDLWAGTTGAKSAEGEWSRGRCSCNQQRSFDYDGYSCLKQFERIYQ